MKITNMHRIRIRLRNAYFADRYCHLVEKNAGFPANSSQFDKIFNYGLKTCWSNEILVFPDITFTQFRLLVLDIMNSSIGQSVKEVINSFRSSAWEQIQTFDRSQILACEFSS